MKCPLKAMLNGVGLALLATLGLSFLLIWDHVVEENKALEEVANL